MFSASKGRALQALLAQSVIHMKLLQSIFYRAQVLAAIGAPKDALHAGPNITTMVSWLLALGSNRKMSQLAQTVKKR
jgi:hypothetical protein